MTADFADALRTDAHDADLGDVDYLIDPADLMQQAKAEERDEIATSVEGHATGLGQEFESVREARICDCEDERAAVHPYAPTTADWEWKPVADAERVRHFIAGTHLRYRTTVTVWIGDAS